jgi:methionine salvage enolase-phosphatase E1
MPEANLKYLVFSGDTPIAALSFRAVSLRLGSRACFIGWFDIQRKKHTVSQTWQKITKVNQLHELILE